MSRFESNEWRTQMRVRLDYTNALAEAIGEDGVTDADLHRMAPQLGEAVAQLEKKCVARQFEWLDLPYQREVVDRVVAYADAAAKTCESFVVLGIGGSALGAIALHTALRHPFHNQLPAAARGGRPRMYVLDNVDPEFVAGALDLLDLRTT